MTQSEPRSHRVAHYALEGAAVLILVSLAALVGTLHFTRPTIPYAPQMAMEQTVQARVLEVLQTQSTEDASGLVIISQEMRVRILSPGDYQDVEVTLQYYGMGPTERAVRFRPNQRALVMISQHPQGDVHFQVADHVRIGPLIALTALFAVVTVLVGRKQGVRALLGLALSVAVIGGFILPQILAHRDATLVSLTGVALLVSVTLYLIQGWNPTGHAALFGLLGSLLLTTALVLFWTHAAHLTGFGAEEALYLQAIGVQIQMRGLLVAGMLIGVAGVLDDVILAQSVTVFELARANPRASRSYLFNSAMKIGVAHLASMVNTLVLAYASAALPLMLLFYLFPEPWHLTINREMIAEEIIRTLVGSLGLLTAVPLTTLIAAWVARTQRSTQSLQRDPS